MILAVDLGNYNIKTKDNIFMSNFVRASKVKDENDPCLLTYEGQKYLMERGKFDNEFNKAEKDYIPNLLYAVSKSIEPGKEAKIKLLLGVPVSNLGVKENIISELNGNTFKFSVAKEDYKITFEKVGIVGEGISSFYMLPSEERKKDIMIVDIGGRTSNICCYKSGKLVISFTIPLGTINLFDRIVEDLNNKGERYEVEEIQEYIEKKIIEPKNEIYTSFINDLYNHIVLRADIRLFKAILTGGGSIVLKDYEKAFNKAGFKNLSYMDNALYTNVLGNQKLAEAKWGE